MSALAVLVTDAVMRGVDPDMRGLDGLWNRELVKAAGELRPFQLKATRNGTYDLDVDMGILRVQWKPGARKKNSPGGHYVAVIDGAIHCTDEHVVMPWRDYLQKFDAKASTLLKVVR